MGDFLIKVLAWILSGVLFIGLILFIIWIIRGFAATLTPCEKIKVYYDDNDHSKGYYYVKKPADTYPVGYPKEQIVKDMEEYERLKRMQKTKGVGPGVEEKGCSHKKTRPMWLQILLMTPAEYIEYRRQKKETKRNSRQG